MAKRDSNFNPIGKSRGVRRGDGSVADWHSVTPVVLMGAIASVALAGGAVRFGYSRDGGAYAVGIYGDGEPYTDFVKPSEDIDDYLIRLKELFEDIRETRMSEETPKKGHKQP